MKTFALTFLVIPYLTFAQTDNNKLVDSIRYVTKVPHCLDAMSEQLDTNSIFWRIVKRKESAVKDLIDKIDDTTQTLAEVRHFGGYYTVGDIAYKALEEIIHGIPTFELLETKFDEDGCGYCSYWNLLRSDTRYRNKFKKNLEKWYTKNRSNLIWIEYKWKGEECFYKNPNHGYLELRK